MRILTAIAILLGVISSIFAKRGEIDPPNGLKASVKKSCCEFYFPEANINGKWYWNNERFGVSENNWEVAVKFSDYLYKIGFSDGNNHSLDVNRGTLKTMLAEGYSYIRRRSWEIGDSLEVGDRAGHTLVERVVTMEGVETIVSGQGIMVRLTNPIWIERFLKEQPKSVVFSRNVLGERYPAERYQVEVRVEYPDSEPK